MSGQVTEEKTAPDRAKPKPKWRYAMWAGFLVIMAVSLTVLGTQNLFLSLGSYYFWVGLAIVICFGFMVNRIRFKRWF
jgi:hypothetical protein